MGRWSLDSRNMTDLYPKIQFVVMQNRALAPQLAKFLDTVAHWRPFTEPVPWAEMHTVRNKAFRWFLTDTTRQWLVMMDCDVVVTDQTAPLLRSEEPIASARFARASDGVDAHGSDTTVGMTKLSRAAVEKLCVQDTGPWLSPGPCACECPAFHSACVEAGFTPVKTGVAGHRVHAVLYPGGELRLDSGGGMCGPAPVGGEPAGPCGALVFTRYGF